MDKKLKAKWVKALRSGKYKQATGVLKYKNAVSGVTSYCCLGVLKSLDPKIRKASTGMELLAPTYCGLPTEIQEKLASMNDGDAPHKPKSFRVIATWIEKNL